MWSCHSELSRAPAENTVEGFQRKHKLGGGGEREGEFQSRLQKPLPLRSNL